MNVNALSATDKAIQSIEPILSNDLKLRLDDIGHIILVDDQNKKYAYLEKDCKTVRFLKRESRQSSMSCRISDLVKIQSMPNKESIEILFKGNEKGIYYPQDELNPVDELLSIIPEKPIYDGSLTSIEELINFRFTELELKKYLFFNELDNKIYLDHHLIGKSGIYPYNADNDLTILIQILEKSIEYEENGIKKHPKLSHEKVDRVLVKIAKDNSKNPFLEEIKKAAAEITDTYKIESFLSDIGISSRLSFDQNKKYVEAVSSALFLAIIERQLVNDEERSIKFVPVIIGLTNLGKSTICKRLGLTDYYRETTVSIADEKSYNESVQGSIIVEQSEGTHFVPGKEEFYKAHFDKNSYQYRKSYARESIKIQKRYLEMITSNDNEILTDITGNIRYYPLFLDDLEKPLIPIQEHTRKMMLSYYVDAYRRYLDGERWHDYVDNEDFQKIADVVRESVTKEIDGYDTILDYLNEKFPNIGEFVPRDTILEYLRENTYLNELKIDKTIRLFGKSCDRHGFIKTTPKKMIIGGKVTSKRGFIRVKQTH